MTAQGSGRTAAADQLWQWYAATVVLVDLGDGTSTTLRPAPAGVAGSWPWADRQAWVLTACNPRSIPLTEVDNAQRHAQLGRELAERGIHRLEATGYDQVDPSWREPGYCLPGVDEALVMDLARRWEQNAVFLWTPTTWAVVGVLLPGRTDHGWTTAG
jgi:hypothetical protein